MKVYGQLLRRLSDLFKKLRERGPIDVLIYPILLGIGLMCVGIWLIGSGVGNIGSPILILGSGIFYVAIILLAWVI